MFSHVSHLECPKCQQKYRVDEVNNLCVCGSPLLVRYALSELKAKWKKESLTGRDPSLWRYHELLPVQNEENVVSMGEGMTPLLPLPRLGKDLGIENFLLKDEGIIPSGTFKARGAAVGVSKAKELGINHIAMPTNGNAGGAWSLYSSRAGIESTIVMPESAPTLPRNECAVSGADLYLVDGLISDAGKIIGEAVKEYGFFDASTLKEPYRIEGKKTMGLEIAEQLNWQVPDVILYPTGGGVGLIGIYKGLKELQQLGWIGSKLPRLVAVQSYGCAPIVQAWKEGKRESVFWEQAQTIAFGITVPKALGDFLVLDAIYETEGCAIAVSDDEILHELQNIAKQEGLFVCPEGAATIVAARKLKEQKWIEGNEVVVAINTGTGNKYPEVVNVEIKSLQPSDRLALSNEQKI